MKAIILARVSTEKQLKEGQSIPAQLARAREYCQRKGFEIKSEYQFDKSSSKDQREKFEKVLEEIKNSKKLALIVETIDRLQRSFRESVILDDLRKQDKVEIHFLRENLIISINSKNYLLQLANRAYDLFVSSEIEEKRQLLKLLLQNPILDGKIVRFTLLKPFDTILNYADSQLWLRR